MVGEEEGTHSNLPQSTVFVCITVEKDVENLNRSALLQG